MVIAIVVVFAVVVFVARGRGGELSAERPDYAPLDLGPVSATDVALLRPPTGLWGYNMQATDEAMHQIAESIRERDVRIVALEQLITDLGRDQVPAVPVGSPYEGARHRRSAADVAASYRDREPFDDVSYQPARSPAEQHYADEHFTVQHPIEQAPAAQVPVEHAPAEQARAEEAPAEQAAPEQVWQPFDFSRPPASGPPPEQSHD
jgi:hypothetical protein